MTNFARPLPSLVAPRLRNTRLAMLAAGLALAISTALLTASPAGALVAHVGPVPVGLQPAIQENYFILDGFSSSPELALPAKYANAEGNPVVHGANTWAIFWDPNKDYYHGDWQNLIDEYFHDSAAESGSLGTVFSVDTQYTDRSDQPASYKQVFRGGAVDTHAYPASGCTDPNPFGKEQQIEVNEVHTPICITSTQVAAELENYIKAHGLPTGLGNIYYIMTPPAVTVCLDSGGPAGHCSDFENSEESYDNSFCSYHAAINPGNPAAGSPSTVLYGVIPWTAGTFGDGDFLGTPGWQCQDGGFDPSSEPIEKPEEAHHPETAKEIEEFKNKNKKEKAEQELAEELEGPHAQEPNQVKCPSEDGFCDVGLADLIINQIGLEQQDIVTDPLLNGWRDPAGFENTDECRFFFAATRGGGVTAVPATLAGTLFNQELAGRNFYLNDAFNYAARLLPFPGIPCMTGIFLEPKFTAPSPVNSGEIVGFDGMESDITLNATKNFSAGGAVQPAYATYTWNFGDGSPIQSGDAPGSPPCEAPFLSPCAASVYHAYQYGGTYNVTLTVRDVGGNTASITHAVTVAGPPRPGSQEGGAGGPGAGGPGSAGGPGAGGQLAAPVAAALILKQNLRTAARKGLVVRYSVNEQVAGHFDVLLSRSVARRLGISAPAATGLPAGARAEVVIAKAIVITTKGGAGSMHIKFSKKTAARLARASKLSLELRLVVRNASSTSPLSTTVVTTATISH